MKTRTYVRLVVLGWLIPIFWIGAWSGYILAENTVIKGWNTNCFEIERLIPDALRTDF